MSNDSLINNSKILPKAIICAVIVTCIALQTYAGIIKLACSGVELPYICNIPEDPSLYPFLNYPMYRSAKPEGVIVPKFAVIATYPNGTEKQLTAEDFALSDYWFTRGIIYSLDKKDDAKTQEFIRDYEQSGKPPFTSLRLDVTPLAIERKGVIEGEPYTVNQVFANTGEAK
jgi:hypothetical protein